MGFTSGRLSLVEGPEIFVRLSLCIFCLKLGEGGGEGGGGQPPVCKEKQKEPSYPLDGTISGKARIWNNIFVSK